MLDTVFIPAEEKASRHLMVVMHGLGDSVEGYRWLPEVLQLPWLNYLLVNAPDSYYGGFSWYDFATDPLPGIERSRKLICQLLDGLPQKGFAPAQTTVFGFSQGCLMTLETTARYPQLFAGIIGISGYVNDPEKLIRELSPVAKQQRYLVTHGTQDPMIPFATARDQIAFLRKAGLPIEWHEFVKEHTIAGEAEIKVIRDFIVAVRHRIERRLS